MNTDVKCHTPQLSSVAATEAAGDFGKLRAVCPVGPRLINLRPQQEAAADV
ncbi:hypothetical protein [Stieleria varia]|uniref:hypothetical protein n=1 Tax=Stieleria varia TaxID=2528005 RepID=UPI0018D253BA|nr:hypothetical protein [Stieleria varia]